MGECLQGTRRATLLLFRQLTEHEEAQGEVRVVVHVGVVGGLRPAATAAVPTADAMSAAAPARPPALPPEALAFPRLGMTSDTDDESDSESELCSDMVCFEVCGVMMWLLASVCGVCGACNQSGLSGVGYRRAACRPVASFTLRIRVVALHVANRGLFGGR